MYVKVILTLLLVAMGAVAVGLWRPQRAPAPNLAAGEILLLTRISDLDLRGVPREQAVNMLQARTSATLVVDWPSISAFTQYAAAYRTCKLDAYLTNVPLATALKVVLGHNATWQVDGTVISVAGNEALMPGEMTVHAYDVSDLASDEYWGVKTPAAEAAAVQAARMERIRDVVAEHTPAGGWHINYIGSGTPGGNASMSVCGDSLIITQTTRAHAEIARVLAELRQGSSPRPR